MYITKSVYITTDKDFLVEYISFEKGCQKFQGLVLNSGKITGEEERLIRGFKDSAPAQKMHDYYQNTQKFRVTFHFHPSDACKKLHCGDVNKPL